MDTHLAVTLTRAYNRRPLAVVHNLPGQDAELYPDQLRALAAALVATADAAEAAATATTGQPGSLTLRGGIRAEFEIAGQPDLASLAAASRAALTATVYPATPQSPASA